MNYDESPANTPAAATGNAALAGLKVVEFAHLISAPMAGTFLADFGAEVVHVEPPGSGDPLRRRGVSHEGEHLWWKVAARNKRSVTLDLRKPAGQGVARRLVGWADVVVTNIRLATLVGWGLDFDTLVEHSPGLIMLQLSGFGTTSSRRDEPGFGKVGEAMSGVMHLTGTSDGPPMHAGFTQADSINGLMGAFGIQAALYRRDHDPNFAGEYIDIALFESLFRLIDWQVTVHVATGRVPTRSGNALTMSAGVLINTYRAADDNHVTISGGTLAIHAKLAGVVGARPEDFATAESAERHHADLDRRVGEWISQRSAAQAAATLVSAGVVASQVYSAADIVKDPTYRERNDVIRVPDDALGSVAMPAVIPHLRRHPGHVWRAGPSLGADNELVFGTYLGMDEAEIADLVRDGVV